MKLRNGMIVGIEFLDHVHKGSTPARFTVYGRLSKITKSALCVDCWCYQNKSFQYDGNVDRYTIVRSAITKLRIYREV